MKGSYVEYMRKEKDSHTGFTLVELIVVMAILTILCSFVVPTAVGYIRKAKEAKYKQEAHEVCRAVYLYLLELDSRNIHPESWELAMDLCEPFAEKKKHPLLPYMVTAPSRDGDLKSIYYGETNGGILKSYQGVIYSVGGYLIDAGMDGTMEVTMEVTK